MKLEYEVSIEPEKKKAIWIPKINIKKKRAKKDVLLFTFMLAAYLIMMLLALIEPESLKENKELTLITFYFGLLMALFSFWIAFCYSVIGSILLYPVKIVLNHFTIKVRKLDEKYYLFLYVIIFMTTSFLFLVYEERNIDIKYISKGYIQNIITWLSLLIFTIDKAISEG